ncbi:MAG: GDP-mannose 4,6-dehydratase [Acidobacteriota bacterium]
MRDAILITGGAGFIGSEVTRQLASASRRVIVVDNMVNGRRENLSGAGDGVTIEVADIRDAARMRALMGDVATVLHLACLGVRHSIHSPRENHDVNATGTLTLLAAAREAGVDRFVHVSSSEVYGTARWVPISEEHPTYPETVYGASKLAGECYARACYRTYGLPTVVVRPFNTYGPRCHHEGDSGEVIPRFMLRCLAGQPMVIFGDGRQTRDFTYVADTARGIIAAAGTEELVGETVNLGSGIEVSVADLARLVALAADKPGAPVTYDTARPGDVRRLMAETSKARQALGFTPSVTLEEGLKLLLAWYTNQPQSPAELLEHEQVRNWTIGKAD